MPLVYSSREGDLAVGVTNQYVLSIDPGKSSGIALGKYSETEPYSLMEAWQFSGGAASLKGVFKNATTRLGGIPSGFGLSGFRVADRFTIISEKFTPLQNKGFGLTMDSVEPLRGEGVLLAFDVMPDYPHETWRRPNEMYLYGGDDLVAKRKRAHLFLKENGMYVTGKTVGCPDANDARSAILHGLSYVARVKKHQPTFDLIAGWTGRIDSAANERKSSDRD